MNLLDRFRAAVRAFVLGPAVVERFDEVWGHSIEQYAPAEYGEYIATSNGVYACATSRAQLLSSLPLKLYRLDRAGRRAEVTAGDLYGLLQKVNPFWTGNRLIEMTELSLCLWGQAFWFLERGESGRQPPREIWWGRPDRVLSSAGSQREDRESERRPSMRRFRVPALKSQELSPEFLAEQDCVVIVADHSKWGVVSNFPVVALAEVDTWVVDEGLSAEWRLELEARRVKVLVAPREESDAFEGAWPSAREAYPAP